MKFEFFGKKEPQESEKSLINALLKMGGQEGDALAAFYNFRARILESGDVTTEDRNLISKKAEETAQSIQDLGFEVSAEEIEDYSLEREMA